MHLHSFLILPNLQSSSIFFLSFAIYLSISNPLLLLPIYAYSFTYPVSKWIGDCTTLLFLSSRAPFQLSKFLQRQSDIQSEFIRRYSIDPSTLPPSIYTSPPTISLPPWDPNEDEDAKQLLKTRLPPSTIMAVQRLSNSTSIFCSRLKRDSIGDGKKQQQTAKF